MQNDKKARNPLQKLLKVLEVGANILKHTHNVPVVSGHKPQLAACASCTWQKEMIFWGSTIMQTHAQNLAQHRPSWTVVFSFKSVPWIYTIFHLFTELICL